VTQLFLFAPADRPERWPKAFDCGADAVILDLEDAVAPTAKPAARAALASGREAIAAVGVPVYVRVNARASGEHARDLEAITGLALAGLILAKTESAEDVVSVPGLPVVALIESARGLAEARAIARVAARLAFGSIDFAADLGCAHTDAALAYARAEIVLASRLGGLAGPIDGVTTNVKDAALTQAETERARDLGFGGKLLIHPAQVAPARAGFAPDAADVAWAERVLAIAGDGAVAVDGAMVDAPVRLRARQILRAAGR
jgi:citrate lyase subunit beta / citryl-CoA lyase